MSSESKYTVWHGFYDILRGYKMTTMFGNPGSTEQPMLKNFPSDFKYVLALQEASAVSMAGGYAEASRKPAIVNLHTCAGTGNGMGAIMTCYLNKVPVIVIAGQQTREMLLGEPLLTNRDPTVLAKPYVKWSYQPERSVDVPAAMIRAISIAVQPPAGSVFLSIPLDDWDVNLPNPVPSPRAVSKRVGPDPEQIKIFAQRIEKASAVALVLGPEVDKALAWSPAVQLAESLHIPVFQSPFCERAVFPETHELYKGPLPAARGPLKVFRYYPWVPGPVVPNGVEILQITNDPNDAAKALVGDAILSDVGIALDSLNQLLQNQNKSSTSDPHSHSHHLEQVLSSHASNQKSSTMMAAQAFSTIADIQSEDAILVHESPSNTADLLHAWKATQQESVFTFASGGLGWNAPAAVGIALAEQEKTSGRVVVAVIGDGSFNYSVQCIYTAVQQKAKIIYLIPVNEEYAVLKEFAELEQTPHVPGLDLPGINIAGLAQAYGCRAMAASNEAELKRLFQDALKYEGPTLIEFPIDRTLRLLVAQTKPGS